MCTWLMVLVCISFAGNIFISRKSVTSCDECEDEGPTTSVVYKIGKHPPQFFFKFFFT